MRAGWLSQVILAAYVSLAAHAGQAAAAEKLVKIGVCARTLSAGLVAPFAMASKLGWFADGGIKVELVPLPGSTDCVKYLASGELAYTLPSIEPVAIIQPQGVSAKMFYTAYQDYGYGIAVAADSPLKSYADLKGKKIGVTSMASAGVIVARALASMNGLNPDHDIKIVVAGEGAQTAALMRQGSVDALSQFDTQYAMVEIAGVKLREFDKSAIEKFPGNGLVAMDKTLDTQPEIAIALGRGMARGQLFAMNNPEAAVRIIYEMFPQTKPTGKDEATAVADDVKVLKARMENWRLDRADVTRWGESSKRNYTDYLAFLVKWGIIPQSVPVEQLTTNRFVDDFNKFDRDAIIKIAKEYK